MYGWICLNDVINWFGGFMGCEMAVCVFSFAEGIKIIYIIREGTQRIKNPPIWNGEYAPQGEIYYIIVKIFFEESL